MDENEVVEILSQIARGEASEEGVKVSERLKAVELLGKHYSLFASNDSVTDGDIRVVVDYVGKCNGSV